MWLSLLAALSAAFSLVWPLSEVRVERRFEPPPKPWAAGHRGVDLAGPAGQEVFASGPGTVAFAGTVANRGVVSLVLDGSGSPPLRTTYEPVEPEVSAGERVSAGQPVGTLQAGAAHCGRRVCLHWGLLRGKRYLDPLAHVRPVRPVLLPVPSSGPALPEYAPTQAAGGSGAEGGGRGRGEGGHLGEAGRRAEGGHLGEGGSAGGIGGVDRRRPAGEDPSEPVGAILDRRQQAGGQRRLSSESLALAGPALALTVAALWAGSRVRAETTRPTKDTEPSRTRRRGRVRRTSSPPPRGARPARRAAPSPRPPP
ncbi:M23 family metallopeptidase [Streptomyces sp. P38-E01]|uniref:M23 family metallopeptidase n=1 Tax=Streptomyces tardus TaxID=2780544 RepID=A0A949JAY7_9ACTN|nr:M23 family metallopeptidase [Streptomyces tardus]MBU7596127.1 M23 family metallopeptidase [Streptomyces tardus]